MGKTLTIDPVTRIEGHAKVTIHLGEDGQVEDARFHVTEFRGFEKFCEGRSFWEMPGITARVCGICPVSHLMASAKAGDAILGVKIPATAEMLRRLMNWAQIVQSHALSFFHLSAPDLLLGLDSEPAKRNVVGLIEKHPDIARKGILLRKFGQDVIRLLGGRSVHPAWTVPGGVREALDVDGRDEILRRLPEALQIAEWALALMQDMLEDFEKEVHDFGEFPSLFMGLVTPSGGLEHYDGVLRVVDANGQNVLPNIMMQYGQEGMDPARYAHVIGEASESWSYLKFPYFKPKSTELFSGMYRVGPLARLNVCKFAGTPKADEALRQFRQLSSYGKPVLSSFHYHFARLVEMVFSLEKMLETLRDPAVTDSHIRSKADVNQLKGIGVSEAPRGTLFHEYEVNEQGILKHVNMLIATGQNNMAMNETVKQIAREYVNGSALTEGMLNRVEAGIRCYDPCLSCSTHAIGQMPLQVQLLSPKSEVIDEVCRH